MSPGPGVGVGPDNGRGAEGRGRSRRLVRRGRRGGSVGPRPRGPGPTRGRSQVPSPLCRYSREDNGTVGPRQVPPHLPSGTGSETLTVRSASGSTSHLDPCAGTRRGSSRRWAPCPWAVGAATVVTDGATDQGFRRGEGESLGPGSSRRGQGGGPRGRGSRSRRGETRVKVKSRDERGQRDEGSTRRGDGRPLDRVGVAAPGVPPPDVSSDSRRRGVGGTTPATTVAGEVYQAATVVILVEFTDWVF